MADQDLPVSGTDTSIKVLVDGALKKVVDQITGFTVRPVTAEIITEPLGADGSKIDHEFRYYEGEITFAPSTTDLDDIQDVVQAGLKSRVPVVINIVSTTRYRDGSKRTYTYPDVKLTFERRARRGQAQEFTVSWKCGNHRTQL